MRLINLLVRILCLASSYTILFSSHGESFARKKNNILIENKYQKKDFIKKGLPMLIDNI